MHQFVLALSSSCDIPPDQIAAYDAHMFSTGFVGIPKEPSTADGYARAYKRISSNKVRRSLPSVKKIEDFFDDILERKDKDIVYISPSSRADEHYSYAIKAAQNSLLKFPRRNIYIINANGVGASLQPLFYLGYKMYLDGASAEDTVAALNELSLSLTTLIVTPDILSTLRVSGVGERKLKLLYRVRSEAAIAKKIIDAFSKSNAETLYISHCNSESLAIKIMQRFNDLVPERNIQVNKMSVVCAYTLSTHTLSLPALIVGF